MKENVEKVISFQTPALALAFVKIVNTNGIDECKKFYATQFNQNTPDWENFWSVKCSKMTFFGHVSENMRNHEKN